MSYPKKATYSYEYWSCGHCNRRHRTKQSAQRCIDWRTPEHLKQRPSAVYLDNIEITLDRMSGMTLEEASDKYSMTQGALHARTNRTIKLACEFADISKYPRVKLHMEDWDSPFGLKLARSYQIEHEQMINDYYQHLLEQEQ